MTRDPHSSDFTSSLAEAARANPVAAALIGGGALWLLVGNQRLKDMAGALTSTAQPRADMDAPNVGTKAAQLSEMSRAAGEAITEQSGAAMQSIKDGVSSAVGTMRDSIADTVDQSGEMVRAIPNPIPAMRQGYGQAQSVLSSLLDRQPLMLGAVGVAIGAALAGAFPITSLENEWAGPSSDDVRAELQARATAVSEKTRGGIGDLASEVRGIAEDTVDRVKRAGQDSVTAARQKATAAPA